MAAPNEAWNLELHNAARLLFVPAGFKTAQEAWEAIQNARKEGKEPPFKSDEIDVIVRAYNQTWGNPGQRPSNFVPPVYRTDRPTPPTTFYGPEAQTQKALPAKASAPAEKFSPNPQTTAGGKYTLTTVENMRMNLTNAQEFYRSIGYKSLKDAMAARMTDERISPSDRMTLMWGQYVITDFPIITDAMRTVHATNMGLVMPIIKELGYDSIRLAADNLIALEPQVSAEKLILIKVCREIVRERESVRKPVATTPAYTPGTRSAYNYETGEWESKKNGNATTKTYGGYNKTTTGGGNYQYNRHVSYLSKKEEDAWSGVIGNYIEQRKGGAAEVCTAPPTVDGEEGEETQGSVLPFLSENVGGNAIKQSGRIDETEAEYTHAEIVGSLFTADSELDRLCTLCGLVVPDNIYLSFDTVVAEMVGTHEEPEKARKLASAILQAMKSNQLVIEAMETVDSLLFEKEKEWDRAKKAALAEQSAQKAIESWKNTGMAVGTPSLDKRESGVVGQATELSRLCGKEMAIRFLADGMASKEEEAMTIDEATEAAKVSSALVNPSHKEKWDEAMLEHGLVPNETGGYTYRGVPS